MRGEVTLSLEKYHELVDEKDCIRKNWYTYSNRAWEEVAYISDRVWLRSVFCKLNEEFLKEKDAFEKSRRIKKNNDAKREKELEDKFYKKHKELCDREIALYQEQEKFDRVVTNATFWGKIKLLFNIK